MYFEFALCLRVFVSMLAEIGCIVLILIGARRTITLQNKNVPNVLKCTGNLDKIKMKVTDGV